MRIGTCAVILGLTLVLAGCEGQSFTLTVGSQEPVRAGPGTSGGEACVAVDSDGRRRLAARSACANTGTGAVRR